MRNFLRFWSAVIILVVLSWLFSGSIPVRNRTSVIPVSEIHSQTATKSSDDVPAVTLVVASVKDDNTTWLEATPPGWRKLVYVVDDPKAPLITPFNKGRESSVYLTYVYHMSLDHIRYLQVIDT